MFSPTIVSSDTFLDMPVSTREFYFQLCMQADDDGVVQPKKVMREVGASDDDLKVLIFKGFVIPFGNGVVIVKHWRVNNLVRKDWYHPSIYQDEVKQLVIDRSNVYRRKIELPEGAEIIQIEDKMAQNNKNIRPTSDIPELVNRKTEVSLTKTPDFVNISNQLTNYSAVEATKTQNEGEKKKKKEERAEKNSKNWRENNEILKKIEEGLKNIGKVPAAPNTVPTVYID